MSDLGGFSFDSIDGTMIHAMHQRQPLQAAGGPKPKRQQKLEAVQKALHANKVNEAFELLEPLRKRAPRDPHVLRLSALVLERRNQFKKALELGRKAAKSLDDPNLTLLQARCHRMMGNTDECVRLCDALLRKLPDSLVALLIKGGALEEAGRVREAGACINPVMEHFKQRGQTPMPLARLEQAKLLVQEKEYDRAVDLLNSEFDGPSLEDVGLGGTALHLKAKAYDRKGDYAAAYRAADRANEMTRVDFSAELYAEQVDVLIENWSAQRLPMYPHSTCDSELPVFVAGMPRSGTSLIDQIIDAHPRGAGVGELATIETFAMKLSQAYNPDKPPDQWFTGINDRTFTRVAEKYVREISRLSSPGVERVVNKALGNNKLVGLLALLFPKTRIIHAIRDPRDVAVSCFMGGFNNNLHAWTTRIDWVARAWEQSMRMMEHWKKVLDIPILDVHYERLVGDPDTEFPRLIEFLGLEWDNRCREFYKSRRTVRTLSYDQVNRPLYTSSAGRHVNYIDFFHDVEFPAYDPYAGA